MMDKLLLIAAVLFFLFSIGYNTYYNSRSVVSRLKNNEEKSFGYYMKAYNWISLLFAILAGICAFLYKIVG